MVSEQPLILSVRGPQAEQFANDGRKVFDARDGRIGRDENCDWVLDAVGVSRLHALVRFLNGIYFIEDRSTNGMLLNDEPMRKGDPSPLRDGDRLQIDGFEIAVNLTTAESAAIAPVETPASPLGTYSFDEPPVSALGDLIPGAGRELVPGGGLDPLAFFDAPYAGGNPSTPEAAPAMASWNHTPVMADRFQPPHSEAMQPSENALLPEHWDLTSSQTDWLPPTDASNDSGGIPQAGPADEPPTPPHEPVSAEPVPVSSTAPASTAPASSSDVEHLLRVAVAGLIDVLRARAEFKNSFRLPATLIQRSENNPLKFAPDVDEAMQRLTASSGEAFLHGAVALNDALEDIRYHQLAMLSGMSTAFRSMLAQFDPARYEPSAGATPHLLGLGRKQQQPWLRYREDYAALARHPDESFHRLFGESFAAAYEDQLARLKSSSTPGTT